MKVYYGCKYAPLELIEACGATACASAFESVSFEAAEAKITPNICGYAKSLITFALSGEIEALALTTCCDAMRRAFDVLQKEMEAGRTNLKFLYLLDLPHGTDEASSERYGRELEKFQRALSTFLEKPFDKKKFLLAWENAASGAIGATDATDATGANGAPKKPVFLLGAHATPSLVELAEDAFGANLLNLTCSGARNLPSPPRDFLREEKDGKKEGCKGTCLNTEQNRGDQAQARKDKPPQEKSLFTTYAASLLKQTPCYRMINPVKRQEFLEEMQKGTNAKGAIFHTMKFCDFYGFEHLQMAKGPEQKLALNVVRVETEGTPQSAGQIKTRLQAFAESVEVQAAAHKKKKDDTMPTFVMGIDSGSTSTDAVILDENKNLVASCIMPTGANASKNAEAAQAKVLEEAGVSRDDLALTVATGYGREAISGVDTAITEITCHAKGAHFLSPEARTIVDIGGQDSKVIRIDERGNVETFVMNDKCAAGTGRFLETLARTMEMSLEDFANAALKWKKGKSHDVTISSMCTVFAESEVVSLVAKNEDSVDIIHGLNKSVAQKTASLAKRAKAEGPYLMTGGVANNKGVVAALEEAFGAPVVTHVEAQLAGALGAAFLCLEVLEK